MKSPDRSTSPASKSTYYRRRIGVAAVGALSAIGAVKTGQFVDQQIHSMVSRDQQVSEMGKFDHPLGTDKYDVQGIETALRGEHVDPSKVTFHKITPSETNPTQAAEDLRARDTWAVADEIAGQSGGQHAMQTGEEVVIPSDQLAAPNTLVSKDNH